MASAEEDFTIYVYGKYRDPLFQMCSVAAKHLSAEKDNVKAVVEGFFETQYEQQLRHIVGTFGGSFAQSKPSKPLVYAETQDSILYFLTEKRFFDWLSKRFRYHDNTRLIFYRHVANKVFAGVREQSGRTYCALGFASGDDPQEVVQFELFNEECPELAKNFVGLMASYNGHLVHRVKAGGWVQAGDITDGSGLNSVSAGCGGYLRHESFAILHDRPGLLGMANHGKDTNGSQFYVTIRELPFLDGKSVIFGRVISGMRTILKIGKVATRNERPVTDIKVYAVPSMLQVGKLGA
eukprot:TRINITY_DN65979_c0_g1_i1.p1 TRINITY_DN65979_c0_g1~~TRINITY_DN65979_c0_g1_i1.p1  ORF type:complete len:294 (+),score=42.28 TRINITY_DN65979_c0_g1_i1:82-963(+)